MRHVFLLCAQISSGKTKSDVLIKNDVFNEMQKYQLGKRAYQITTENI